MKKTKSKQNSKTVVIIGISAAVVIGITVLALNSNLSETNSISDTSKILTKSETQIYKDCTMVTYGTTNADVDCLGLGTLHLVRDLPLSAANVKDVTLTISGNVYSIEFIAPLGKVTYDLTNLTYDAIVYQELVKNFGEIKIPFGDVEKSVRDLKDSLKGVPLIVENIIKESSESVVIPKLKVPEINIPKPEPTKQLTLSELKQTALEDINKYRTQNNLRSITLGTAISPQLYAEELLVEGCIHHVSVTGEGPMLRYKNNSDKMFLVAENIAGGLGLSWGVPEKDILRANYDMMYDDAHANWGHHDNILNPHHKSVSIGIAYDNQRLVMVQDFEQPLPPEYSYHPSSFAKQSMDQKFCW